jgi:hypothetical protein
MTLQISTLINIGLVIINLIIVCMSLKMLTEYWKDKKK